MSTRWLPATFTIIFHPCLPATPCHFAVVETGSEGRHLGYANPRAGRLFLGVRPGDPRLVA